MESGGWGTRPGEDKPFSWGAAPTRPAVQRQWREWVTAGSPLTSQPLQPLLPPPPPHHQQEHKQQEDPHQDAGDGHQHLEPLVGRQPFFALDN